ncbi:MAG: aminomethyl-transferring glycine dehydrogenase subunit GcvPB [Deltaproteobacteria bacterium]|nr:aminomethyl-transferring glycine dehydrogenase subunit GcvPB [Deltaproteobacteria bacterium]
MKPQNPQLDEPLIFKKSSKMRNGISILKSDVGDVIPGNTIPKELLREDIKDFPEVSEIDVVRHFTRLSQWNFGVDTGFYPLGSCTMKYNPKINEDIARLAGFSKVHPYQSDELNQGALQLMCELEEFLCEISGMDAATLQPAAGAHGELCGMLMIAKYFKEKDKPRKKVIIPDTAHGTNPASSNLAGFTVVSVKEENVGVITPEAVASVMDEDTAALMLTNPNTIGLFEKHIKEIAEIVHKKGGFIYCDGANLNAIMGIAKLGDMGVDVIQFNLHKTFSTPHGGGGPGSGPVGVKKLLEPYLPKPRIIKKGKRFSLDYNRPKSIGRLKAFYGNFAIMARAYSYIRAMGHDGLKKASEMAVLNANYIREKLKGHYYLPYNQTCMHESVFSDKFQSEKDVHTIDIAKRLMDYGFHPPTIYFPLIVSGAIMIEPTETETKETLDSFINAMISIAQGTKDNPDIVKNAPHTTQIGRLDETRAARNPILRWKG